VRVYDYVDAYIPILALRYELRLKGYNAIGYTIQEGDEQLDVTGFTSPCWLFENPKDKLSLAVWDTRGDLCEKYPLCRSPPRVC